MKVRNRSTGYVGYTIPELSVRRRFAAGEVKDISQEELEKLAYQPGGMYILVNYLQVSKEDATKLSIDPEREYFLSEQGVKDLITTASLDEFLDALDFAPKGVIDMIKDLAIKLPMTDTRKIQALQEKVGIDVLKVIEYSKEEEAPAPKVAGRRTETPAEPAAPTRRVTDKPKYTIVNPE